MDKHKILILGDSLVEHLFVTRADSVHVASEWGATAQDMRREENEDGLGISWLLDEDQYKICVICAGFNDRYERLTSEISGDVLYLADKARSHKTKPLVFISEWPHNHVAPFIDVGYEKRHLIIPKPLNMPGDAFQFDHVHLSKNGRRAWQRHISHVLTIAWYLQRFMNVSRNAKPMNLIVQYAI